jgi:hypothetical protein
VRLAITAGASYAALYVILLSQALRGESLVAPDGMTVVLLGAWLVGTAAAVAAPLLRLRSAQRPLAV